MSTRRLRNTWWVDFSTEGVRYRKRSPENSQAGARAYEAVLRQRVSKGESLFPQKPPPPKPYFRDFTEEWFRTYVITNNKPSEQWSKRLILNARLKPSFGNLRLDEITSHHIETFKMEQIKIGLSPKTINNYLTVLGKCLRVAHEWEVVPTVPIIKFLRVPPQRFDFLSPEESSGLVAAATDSKWRVMVIVALRTGLRLGELLGLEWSCIDLEKRILAVRQSNVCGVIGSPKNNRERHIPLTHEVYQALRAIQRTNGYVFGKRDGLPYLTRCSAEQKLQETCSNAGIRPIGWHTLRHTFASHLIAAGISIRAVQELLGHSDIRMTMRYSHLSPSTLQAAVSVLDKFPLLGQQAGNTPIAETQPITEKAVYAAFSGA